VNVLSDGFGNWVGAGFCEMVDQRSGVIGEGIEFDNREVSLRERPSFIEEDGRGVLSVLNRLDGLVTKSRWIKLEEMNRLTQRTLNSIPFFAATDTAITTTIGTHRDIAHGQLTTKTVIIFINAPTPAFSVVLCCTNLPTNIQIKNTTKPSTNTTGAK
jgi:hypothetical protein